MNDKANSFLPIISEVCAQHGINGWRVPSNIKPKQFWIHLNHTRARMPAQGWKLHVSTGLCSAEETLRRALLVLFAEDANFKVAASMENLGKLNSGLSGISQVGKFMTIYPNDDTQAIRLALALDEATRGLRGPDVPTDRPLKPGSRVTYRYGGFEFLYVQLPGSEVESAIRTPDGQYIPDMRGTTFQPPTWAIDPFVAAGVAPELSSPDSLFNQRYLVMGQVDLTARGTIAWAVDLIGPRRCILKRAPRDAMLDANGLDARDRLRREAQVLARLAPDPRFPALIELFEQGEDVFLAMEDVAGTTLDIHIKKSLGEGRRIPDAQIVAWGRELAAMLDAIHTVGFIYRDVKSLNTIVAPDPDRHLRLIDFDIAHERAREDLLMRFGTHGYRSPQQAAGETPQITDDVYGVGALLYFAATGAEPAASLQPFALLARPIELMNPGIAPALAQVIERCLDPDASQRFQTMAELDAALASVIASDSVIASAEGAKQSPHHNLDADAASSHKSLLAMTPENSRALAQLIGARLGAELEEQLSRTAPDLLPSFDLYSGVAGTLIAYAEIVGAFGDDASRAALAKFANQLNDTPRPNGKPITGLYLGEGGIAAAILRAGQILRDDRLIALAAERARRIATLPFNGPDLISGAAGRVRVHLWLWDETQEREQLDHARAAGEFLLASATCAGDDESCWTIPPGFDEMSGKTFLGYGHGAAGIADALLDLYEATGDARFLDGARGAARWLARLAVPSLDDASGLNWPVIEGASPTHFFWCHGATGIGKFFLHAAAFDLVPNARDFAERAARAVACGARWAGISQCHGLAGNIEYLLDLFQATGARAYLAECNSLAFLLQAQITERKDARIELLESSEMFAEDYMMGSAGVAVCLLRLSDPERVPHQLSRRGFRQFNQPSRAMNPLIAQPGIAAMIN